MVKYIIAIAVFLSFMGCSKDEGNYNYTTDGLDIEVKSLDRENQLTWTVNDEITLRSVVVPADVANFDMSRLKFEWSYNNKVLCTDSVWKFYPSQAEMRIGSNYITLIVTDTKYNLCYYSYSILEITSAYGDGFVILSDNAGASELSYYKLTDGDVPEIERGVYSKVNGEALGTGPIRIHKTNFKNSVDGRRYEWEIMQESGGVAIKQWTLERSAYINEEFVGGNAPAGFVGVNGLQRDPGSAIISKDGNVYVRNLAIYDNGGNVDVLPHSGLYGQSPVYISGGLKITKALNFDNYCNEFTAWASIPYMIMYDELNNRLVFLLAYSDSFDPENEKFGLFYVLNEYHTDGLMPGETSPSDSSLIVPDLGNLGNYTVVSMTARVAEGASSGQSDNYYVLKDNLGKYYMLEFSVYVTQTFRDVDINDFYQLPFDASFNDDSQYESFVDGEPYLLYTGGSNNSTLFAYNMSTMTNLVIYQASSTITTIKMGVSALGMFNEWLGETTPYQNRLLLGTSNGDVVLLDVSNTSLSQSTPTVLDTQTGFGKVVDIELHLKATEYGYFGY